MSEVFSKIKVAGYDWVPEGQAMLVNAGEEVIFHLDLDGRTGRAEIKKPTGVKIVNLRRTKSPYPAPKRAGRGK